MYHLHEWHDLLVTGFPKRRFKSNQCWNQWYWSDGETWHNQWENQRPRSVSTNRWSLTPETESCHDASFVATGGTGGRQYDNLWCRQWRRSWHHGNYWFSEHSNWQVVLLIGSSRAVNVTSFKTTQGNKTMCRPYTLVTKCWQAFFTAFCNEFSNNGWYIIYDKDAAWHSILKTVLSLSCNSLYLARWHFCYMNPKHFKDYKVTKVQSHGDLGNLYTDLLSKQNLRHEWPELPYYCFILRRSDRRYQICKNTK